MILLSKVRFCDFSPQNVLRKFSKLAFPILQPLTKPTNFSLDLPGYEVVCYKVILNTFTDFVTFWNISLPFASNLRWV